jgi:murein L,D-transpeptidase YcbB/YkuD
VRRIEKNRQATSGENNDILKQFYKDRNYQPVWFDHNNRMLTDIDRLETALLNSAFQNGLNPENYSLENVLDDLQKSADHKNLAAKREWQLSQALLKYLHDLSHGAINTKNFDPLIFMPPEGINLEAYLSDVINSRQPEDVLASLEPQQQEYQQLKEQLAKQRELRNQNHWFEIKASPGTVVYPGESHEIIPQLRERMAHYDYDGALPRGIWVDQGRIADAGSIRKLADQRKKNMNNNKTADTDKNPDLIYDDDLLKKIAEYQYFHGKKIDGVIGPQTLNALNMSYDDRIDQIKLAMERWRWFPQDMKDRHIFVNTAAFYTKAIENGQEVFVMPIIVGEVAHQTPVFGSVISNVRMHPDWTVPTSIAQRYLIEKIQKNPRVINQLGYQIQYIGDGVKNVSWDNVNINNLHNIDLSKYRFRQKPGHNNALGLVRFSIENHYSIYMHGTPSMTLFNEGERTFSSGCIRVQDPLTMAKFILKEKGMSDAEIENLYYLDEGEDAKTEIIPLEENLPVYLTYATAWIDRNGNINFSDDVYGRDKKLKQAFSQL